jgi:hypothetical protein
MSKKKDINTSSIDTKSLKKSDEDDKVAKKLLEESDSRNTRILIAMFIGSCLFMGSIIYSFPALTE